MKAKWIEGYNSHCLYTNEKAKAKIVKWGNGYRCTIFSNQSFQMAYPSFVDRFRDEAIVREQIIKRLKKWAEGKVA